MSRRPRPTCFISRREMTVRSTKQSSNPTRLNGLTGAVAVLFFAAVMCGSAVGGTLRVGLGTDAFTLDPHALNSGSTTLVVRQIYEALVSYGKDLEKAPALAMEWSNPEPTRWRFHLRPNVRFHDGAEFDAD